jgi:hypothetical protein
MSWQDDKTWSDRFMPDIKAVLGQHLLGEASREDDAKHATDLVVLHMKDVRIAVRMRRRRYAENEHYVGQFTIRTERRSGVKTELAKGEEKRREEKKNTYRLRRFRRASRQRRLARRRSLVFTGIVNPAGRTSRTQTARNGRKRSRARFSTRSWPRLRPG